MCLFLIDVDSVDLRLDEDLDDDNEALEELTDSHSDVDVLMLAINVVDDDDDDDVFGWLVVRVFRFCSFVTLALVFLA